MDHDNPYAPPVESADSSNDREAPQPYLRFSEQGWEIVASMSKWMRFVSTVQYLVGILLFSAAVLLLLTGSSMLPQSLIQKGIQLSRPELLILFVAVGFLLGATWLRQAANHFYHGVLADAELALAQGFRKLRLYFILYGCWGLLELLTRTFSLVITKGVPR